MPPGVKEGNWIRLPEVASEYPPLRQWLIGIVKDQTEQAGWRMEAFSGVLEMPDDAVLIDTMVELLDWYEATAAGGREDVLFRHQLLTSEAGRALTVKEPGESCLRIIKAKYRGRWREELMRIAENRPPSNPEMDTREEKAFRDAKARGARALLARFGESPEEQ